MFKKIVLSILAFIVLTFSFVPYAQAQDVPWYNQSPTEWYTKVYNSPDNEIFGERYTAAQIDWIIYGVLFWIPTKVFGPKIMICGASIQESLTNKIGESKLVSVPTISPDTLKEAAGVCISELLSSANTSQSLIGKLNMPQKELTSDKTFLGEVFSTERPISAIRYFSELKSKFSLVPSVKAADANSGFGFSGGLNSILPLWRVVRDFSYGLFVIIIVIFAFMIMFRIKISPQVVISVQSALPKIVIALILITFSYAIAGLLVDLLYVVIAIISMLAVQAKLLGIDNTLTMFNWLTLGQWGSGANLGTLFLSFMYIFYFGWGLIISAFAFIGIIGAALIIGVPSVIALFTGGWALLIIIPIVIVIALLVIAIYNSIRIFFMLFKTYANIIISTIFAPAQILLGLVVPNFGFNQWLTSYISNLLVFAATGGLFLLSFHFVELGILYITNAFGVDPALIIGGVGGHMIGTAIANSAYEGWPPLLGSVGGSAGIGMMFIGVSYIIYSQIPHAAELVQGLISGKQFNYGSAIGEAAGPVSGPVVGIGKAVVGGVQQEVGKMAGQRFNRSSAGQWVANLGTNRKRTEETVKVAEKVTSGSDAPAA